MKHFLILFISIPVISLAQNKDEAVALAREGQYEKALSILDSLHKINPSQELLADLIVVNTWAGQHEKAIKLYKKVADSALPLYVHKAILASAKEVGNPSLGLKAANYGLSVEGDTYWLLRKAQFLTYLQQYAEAEIILVGLETSKLKAEMNLIIHLDKEEYFLALIDINQILSFEPTNTYALEKQMEIRAKLGLANTVDLGDLPKTITIEQIQYQKALEHLRWSNSAPTIEVQQEEAAKALAIFDQIINTKRNQGIEGNLAYDRWAALRHTGNCRMVLTEAHSIEGQSIPNYAKQIIAACALELRMPQKAKSLYEEVLNNDSTAQPPLDYFYALSDLGETQKALEWIQSLRDNTGVWVRYNGMNAISPNEDRLDLDLMEVSGYQYTNGLKTAWELIREMELKAPTNSFILEQKANVAAARGWHRMALTDYLRANTLNPKNLGIQEGLLNTYLALNRQKEAKQILDTMASVSPKNQATIRALGEWQRSQMWESWTNIVYSNSRGPVQNGQGFRATSEGYSMSFNDKFRWMGKVQYEYTQIPEGEVEYTKVALGADYRFKNWELLGQIHGNFTYFQELGAALRSVWTPNDYKVINLEIERFSSESPQRGFFSGVRADHASASFTQRWSEQTSLSLGLQYMWFTDGNRRYAQSVSIDQQLLTKSSWNLSGSFSAYSSSNTASDVLYFNPERDLSLSPAIHVNHTIKSNYEFSFTHALSASTGYYQQKNFDANWNYNLRYEQNISFNYLHSLAWSFSGGRKVYDGIQEPTYIFELLYYAKF